MKENDNTKWKNLPDNIDDVFGFVYLIRNNHPKSKKKYYIGKKQCKKRIKRKPLKGKKRNRICYVDNDVENYWGSSKELLADIEKYGIEHFSREVIELCDSKFHMAYAELCWQIATNALIDERWYNGILNVRLGKAPKTFQDSIRDVAKLNLD